MLAVMIKVPTVECCPSRRSLGEHGRFTCEYRESRLRLTASHVNERVRQNPDGGTFLGSVELFQAGGGDIATYRCGRRVGLVSKHMIDQEPSGDRHRDCNGMQRLSNIGNISK